MFSTEVSVRLVIKRKKFYEQIVSQQHVKDNLNRFRTGQLIKKINEYNFYTTTMYGKVTFAELT